jgi:NAD(P)-dependent dehydrogenase (short-subunit alcohol dehydrogenase family)
MQGKVFIVTGAASGIGYATATQLLARGAYVSAGDLRADALANAFRDLKKKYDKHLYCKAVDVTKREQVKDFITATVEHFGRLDGYANVAGTGGHRLGHEYISELSDEEYDFIMDVNVRATYLALSEALKPEVFKVEGGSIVCVGSMFGRRGFKKGAVFAASKHAMAGMARSVALEAGERAIRVNVVEP